MSRGRYLSLEEARNLGKLDRFAKEHPSEADADRFQSLLDAMVGEPKEQPPRTAKAKHTKAMKAR